MRKDEFANDFLMPALKANALYQKRYPLVSALSRPVIARHLARVAKELGADSVAHGCTGKGNDQVRFEAAVAALAPELTSIAPIRDLALTRDKAIVYAEEHGLPIKQSKKNPYSIDKNVWGRAVETGFLEDPWNAPIEDLYEYTADPAADGPADEVTITFTAGIPTAHRRRRGHAAAGGRAAERARRQARRRPHRHRRGSAGRHQEPRGLRGSRRRSPSSPPTRSSRTSRSSAPSTATSAASRPSGPDLVYDGLWFSGLKRSLDAFIDHTQEHVSGEIRLTLQGGRATVTGRTQRREPVRLLSRDLRHRRHLRPVAGQGIHRDLVAAVEDLGASGTRQ